MREEQNINKDIIFLFICTSFRYAASYALERQKNLKFDFSYNATRSGRSGDDCFTLYQTCNEAV